MQWFYNFNISKKLLCSSLISVGLMIILSLFSLLQLQKVNQISTDMEENWMPSAIFVSAMNTNAADYRVAELQHILSVSDAEMANYEKTMNTIYADFETNRNAYAKLISLPEEKKVYEAFTLAWNDYMTEHKLVLELSRANRNDEAKLLIREKSEVAYGKAGKLVDQMIKINIDGGNKASRLGDLHYHESRTWIIAQLLFSIALGLAMALFIARIISAQLRIAVSVAQRVAAGDLTGKIDVTSTDETGKLMQALKDMSASLQQIVGQVRSGTDTIATASSQIANGNLDLSSRTEEQAGSLEETASSMEELTSTVKQNADNARQANQLALTASDVAIKTGAVVSKMVDTMGSISQSAKKIGDIIGVIDGIAFQTNILALNAAVEAARAGDQGRGFAVVASEVRNLAQRCAAAAKEIKMLVGDSIDKVNAGNALVSQTGAAIDDVVNSAKRVADIISEITAASQEQSAGINQINQAMMQMDTVTQQNAALVEEAAAAAASLEDQAAHLTRVVSVFKLHAAEDRPSVTAVPAARRIPVNSPKTFVNPKRLAQNAIRPQKIAGAGLTTSNNWEEF